MNELEVSFMGYPVTPWNAKVCYPAVASVAAAGTAILGGKYSDFWLEPPFSLHRASNSIGCEKFVTSYRSASVPDFHRIPCTSCINVDGAIA